MTAASGISDKHDTRSFSRISSPPCRDKNQLFNECMFKENLIGISKKTWRLLCTAVMSALWEENICIALCKSK